MMNLRSLAPAAILLASRGSSRAGSRLYVSATANGTSACFAHAPTIPNETANAVKGLEPSAVWSHFASLSSIPRPSGKEEAVLSYIKEYADSKGLPWKEDAAGNLVVFRQGSGGGEDAPPVILQGHVDMVTEKNQDTDHDFDTDPILLQKLEGSWIGAQGTTLGADNGLGVAAALALLGDESRPLPPIEALFTVDEETGLNGAAKLDAEALGLTGSTMLNLDMEEWGDLFVGCAGGGDSTVTIPIQRKVLSSSLSKLLEIRVEGLMGGHSGLNIHEGRANAVILCAAAAQSALEAGEPGSAALVSICGGDKHNAIPREASAVLALSPSTRDAIEASVRASAKAAADEFGLLEKGLRIHIKDVSDSKPGTQLDEASASRLLSVLLALPHGPIKYSHALPGLVETSNNLASISMTADSDDATILCSSRSSIGTALERTRDMISSVAFLAGGSVVKSEAYPGWAPNPKSDILDVSKRLLAKRINEEPGVNAVHAGLECGLLIEKLGGNIDVISFGPTITGAHSPDERVDADTVLPFYELVTDILAEYAAKK